jgi:hypothetical protein
MDGTRNMTTEVQIGKSRLHLELLRKVISRTASWLNMSRKDIEDTENAVSRTCLWAMNESNDGAAKPVCVRVSAIEACVVVEITNSSARYTPLVTSEATEDLVGEMDVIRSLVDNYELLPGDNTATIRLTKRSRAQVSATSESAAYLTNSLQI